MNPQTISILGCGWLGLPLADYLRREGYVVKGSTTGPENFDSLREKGVEPFYVVCDPELRGDRLGEFFQTGALVITLPFRRGLPDPSIYLQQIQSIIHHVRQSGQNPFVVLTGSTAVYPSDIGTVDEEAAFEPENARAETLLAVEQFLLKDCGLPSTVLRLGGLYGPGRPVGKFLAGKTEIPGGDQPVNLVHQEDAVRAVYEVIAQSCRGEIFNVVSDGHPSRRELYIQAARKMDLPAPQFSEDSNGPGKAVLNQKIKERLNFHFLHPDPLDDTR